jgi:DNA-directed RNA polymerase specialized sigma24 family protein
MPAAEPERDPGDATVRIAVTNMLVGNDWRLLTADELTQQVLDRLNHTHPPVAFRIENATGQETARPWRRYSDPIEAVALRIYAEALCSAYVNRSDEERQARAYYELFDYTFRAARNRAKELTREEQEEITYHVVVDLYIRLVDSSARGIRVPGAFLAVALQQVKNAVRSWRTYLRHLSHPMVETGDGTFEPKINGLPDTNDANMPDEAAERAERRAQIVQLFRACLKRYPRARIQLHVVWLHKMDCLDYPMIADQLDMTVENVRLLYFRGIKRLRDIPGFRALDEE